MIEQHPGIMRAISENNPIKLGEIAAMIVHGNYFDRGAAHQASHPVMAFINGQLMDFSNVESAKNYISKASLRGVSIFKRKEDGSIESVPN